MTILQPRTGDSAETRKPPPGLAPLLRWSRGGGRQCGWSLESVPWRRWPWKFGAFSMGNLGKSRENPWKLGKFWENLWNIWKIWDISIRIWENPWKNWEILGKSMEISWNPWKHQNMRKSMEKLGHFHQNMDTSMNNLGIFIRKLWKNVEMNGIIADFGGVYQ